MKALEADDVKVVGVELNIAMPYAALNRDIKK